MAEEIKEGFYVQKNVRRDSEILLCYVTKRDGKMIALFPGSDSSDLGYLEIRSGAGLDRCVGLDPELLQPGPVDPFKYLREHNEHLVKFIADRITASQLEKAASG